MMDHSSSVVNSRISWNRRDIEGHWKVTPLWPQENGEVERQNRSILKRLKIAQIEKRNWYNKLSDLLIIYRTTPHSTTGISPSEMLFKRKISSQLPILDTM
jgi:hypothetical protein